MSTDVQEPKEIEEKKKKTPKKVASEPKMLVDQYFTKNRTGLTRYEVAYLSALWAGILKSEKEWSETFGGK